MEVFGVVYLIINLVNGKKYVGQTIKTVEKRFKAHARQNTMIGRAIRKHGKENFRFGVIKSCASKSEMDYWEKFFIKTLKTKSPNGYNLTDGGEGIVGLKRTSEHKRKIGIANTGKKRSIESRMKIRASRIGKPLLPERCAKISKALKGFSKSLQHCVNISLSKRGNTSFKNLIAEIDRMKLTYTSLAKFLGLTHQNVSRKMLRQRNFTEKDKVKLAEIFGKPIEYLLQETF